MRFHLFAAICGRIWRWQTKLLPYIFFAVHRMGLIFFCSGTFVFNEANRQHIQTVVMIVRTDIDNGLPCKLTRPGKEDSFRSCGDCSDSDESTGNWGDHWGSNNYYNQQGLELVCSVELAVVSGHETSNVSTITTPSHFLLALISTHAGLCQFYQHH